MGADTTCDKQEISCSAIVDALILFLNHFRQRKKNRKRDSIMEYGTNDLQKSEPKVE